MTLTSRLHHMPGRHDQRSVCLQYSAWWCQGAVKYCHWAVTYGWHMPSDKASYGVSLHMQLICMAKKRGTKVINVVRREDVVQELNDLGYASHVSGLRAFWDG